MQTNDDQIKQILLDGHYVTEEDIVQAQQYADQHGTSITDFLFAQGLMSKQILGQAVGEHFGVAYADLLKEKFEEEVFVSIPEPVAREHQVVAFARTEDHVKIAVTDPGDFDIVRMVEKRVGHPVIVHYTTEGDMQEALSRYKAGLKQDFALILERLKDDSLSREDQDALTVTMVDKLIEYGYENKTSDIHIEPYDDMMVVRFRIDGIMHDVLQIPKELSEIIISRIKIMARMRTDEHRSAQDGKLRYDVEDDHVDVRVSVVPVTEGENVVMRLLSSQNRQYHLADIGFSSANLDIVNNAIKDPHGMILVTGPTGSGKTTTLYAVMKVLNKRDVHIATIEDPVEYDIEGISQIQVNTKTDLTFAKGLRALVRQDPDIIMVGEIRDEETAGIAVNSALTGHLVLSTLHTNDAATTLPRLLDMGVEPFLVASTVNLAIAQRLVRKICGTCRSSYTPDEKEKKMIEQNKHIKELLKKHGHKTLKSLTLYKGTGCNVCGDTGYDGRMGIFEILVMSEEIKALILKQASSDELEKKAREEGMITMFEDGVDKVLNGITTFDEVLRVAQD